MHESTPLSGFRLIDDGERLAIHRVAIDDAGSVVAWDPEPVRLEVSSGGINDQWRIAGLAFGAANCTASTAPVLLLRDGKLIELPAHGGEDDERVSTCAPALAA